MKAPVIVKQVAKTFLTLDREQRSAVLVYFLFPTIKQGYVVGMYGKDSGTRSTKGKYLTTVRWSDELTTDQIKEYQSYATEFNFFKKHCKDAVSFIDDYTASEEGIIDFQRAYDVVEKRKLAAETIGKKTIVVGDIEIYLSDVFESAVSFYKIPTFSREITKLFRHSIDKRFSHFLTSYREKSIRDALKEVTALLIFDAYVASSEPGVKSYLSPHSETTLTETVITDESTDTKTVIEVDDAPKENKSKPKTFSQLSTKLANLAYGTW